ncbi:MAG TPA: fumarylacetoacetase [Actinospica sp.]|jgi:fumarylacetoacetase|nr:fumarylacetoacetase [Actinospica sp.]
MTDSWLDTPEHTGFGLDNLPHGVVAQRGRAPQIAIAIGTHALPLGAAAEAGLFDGVVPDTAILTAPSLDRLLAAGPAAWHAVRARAAELLGDSAHAAAVRPLLLDLDAVSNPLPFTVADYVDFYSSRDHAENLGRIFRPNGEALMPNWTHLPIGYHGRSGTVVVSGTPIVRPHGQRLPAPGAEPVFGPTTRLDIEAEVGFVVGVPSRMGQSVSVDEFADHVFGAVLVNDWSARDIQAWEYQPLGPFLGKSFATSVSPWIVPLEALADARVAPPRQDPVPLPHLLGDHWGYDLSLRVDLNGTTVSRPPFAGLYWTAAQQLAHMTSNGASLRTGDLFASGTVSGPERGQRGSFIELTWNGAEPLQLADGSTRSFLADGDTVVLSGSAPGPGGTRIGFGAVTGTIQSK